MINFQKANNNFGEHGWKITIWFGTRKLYSKNLEIMVMKNYCYHQMAYRFSGISLGISKFNEKL